MTGAFIAVDKLVKRYGANTVIDHVSFEVPEGEFLTFLGPSGCGKTTTLRSIAGFIQQDSGAISIGGQDMTGVPPYRRHLGMVFQNYALFPHLSVFENVAFGLRIRGVDRTEATKRIETALARVRLAGLGSRLPKQLSGGQQQRVALARALVYEPRVLLLDEPLSNLDAKLRVEMRSEIRALQRDLGVTALYVTHDQEEALSVSDRIMVMNEGRIEQLSTPWQLYNQPETTFVASFVGTSNILPASVSDGAMRVAESFDIPCPGSMPRSERGFWCVIRPEAIGLGPAEAGGVRPGTVGTVQSITLLGASLRCEIDLVGKTRILVDLPHAGSLPSMATGDKVALHFDPARTAFIPRTTA
jgi:ABC-type Fe3+/spermidine/putrescine transport system ATPase subunit